MLHLCVAQVNIIYYMGKKYPNIDPFGKASFVLRIIMNAFPKLVQSAYLSAVTSFFFSILFSVVN